MTTKNQELKTLEQIRKIVEALGEDSYIGTAFTGAFELAEQNIEYDAAFSAAYYIDATHKADENAKHFKVSLKHEQDIIIKLKKDVEKEQEWKPFESNNAVSQAQYEKLANCFDTKEMTDTEAKQLIADEFGFQLSKIAIIHSVSIEEVNRHRHLRTIGEAERKALFNSTDWNYIRFDVGCCYYEMYDGALRLFYC